MTAASIYALCQPAPPNSPADDLCLSFVVGFVQGLALGDAESASYGRHVCIPDGITGPQFETLVRDYIAAHPESIALKHSGTIIGSAIYPAFPCKPGETSP